MPATGVTAILKTQKQIRPGIVDDYFIVPIYQGEYGADGIKALYNDHVYDVKISGENLPALLPANSDVEITLKSDRSGKMQFLAFFPYLGFTEEIIVDTSKVKTGVDAMQITNQINSAKQALFKAKNNDNVNEIEKVSNNLTDLEAQLEQGKANEDRKFQVLNNLRKEMKLIDGIENEAEWPKIVQELKNEFYELEELLIKIKELDTDEELQISKIEEHTAELKIQVEKAIKTKDIKTTRELIDKIGSLDFSIRDSLAGLQMDINLLQNLDSEFNSNNWTNANRARDLINRGLQMINNNPSKQALRQILIQILDLRQSSDLTSDRLKRGR
jgi:molecular chaperone DnaK